MPYITPQTRELRRAKILDAAREQFTRNGFHATSMDDIVAAAGVSAGGVYRHFPSKSALIAAIASQVITDLGAQLAGRLEALAATGEPDLMAVIAEVLQVLDSAADGPGRLALQVWGEAQRDPEIAELARGGVRGIRRVVEAHVPSTADSAGLVKVVFALMAGYLVQRCVVADVDPASFSASLSAFDAQP
jgi:AcrR family transcriptional regulator